MAGAAKSAARLNALAVIVLAGLAGPACANVPDASATVSPSQPSYEQFVGADDFTPGVHVFLENQCGNLDCHGQISRPYRIYSENGLRLPNDAGLVSGSGAITSDELFASYLAAISLEPEEMTRVVTGVDPPTDLLLVKKPMGLERHKGGTRIELGSSMYNCLTSWLTSEVPGAPPFQTDQCAAAAALQ